MADQKLANLIADARVAERYVINLAFGFTLKGINTTLKPTAYETATVAAAEARWLLAENTLAAYRSLTPPLPQV